MGADQTETSGDESPAQKEEQSEIEPHPLGEWRRDQGRGYHTVSDVY